MGGPEFLSWPLFPVAWKLYPMSRVEGKQASVCQRNTPRWALDNVQKFEKEHTRSYTYSDKDKAKDERP